MKSKLVSDSSINDYPVAIFPGDLNTIGTVFGGKVLSEMDKLAGFVACRHCHMSCVTLGVDSVRFLAPARQGEVLIFKASVNRVWGSSLEIGVKVMTESLEKDDSRHILSAYVTFVAIDLEGKPSPIPIKLKPVSKDEKRRYKEAEKRRQYRLRNKRP